MSAPAPIGYFVHHQGRGHATRAAALIAALPRNRPVTVFCARDDIFPPLPPNARIRRLPSLFEPTGRETGAADWVPTPDTLHCAPLGWPGIREAMAILTDWFHRADPALIVSDVSAEIAQLARICSVPHVMVLQHGDRGDPGHRAAYDGAAGILAPFAEGLAQPDWDEGMRARTCFAGGLGADRDMPDRAAARGRLRIGGDTRLAVIVSGGGGDGLSQAPLGVGARSLPDWDFATLGKIRADWHATEPGNLTHLGWRDDAADWIAAADLVIASTGNTTCQQILRAGRPWIAVPEWRYFDEQLRKAEALARAGAAHHLPHLPSSARAWRAAVAAALAGHDAARQAALCPPDAAGRAARWLEGLIARLSPEPTADKEVTMPDPKISVLTIARGRAEHLRNVLRGLARQTRLPGELVIARMQDHPYDDLPETPFPVRQVHVPGDELPLAAARNAAAKMATGDRLIFLDVDCIPHPELVADYDAGLSRGGLVMGEVAYLPGGATAQGLDFDAFDRVAQRHSDRRGPPEDSHAPCDDYRCFWSLNFALDRATWDAAGGFDECFFGYGGEDTDFGRTLSERGIPIWWLRGARVYHQYHPHAMPPVHHLHAILRNAEVFASKWGHRTMEHWLHAFRMMGLIENTPDGLRVLREPDEADRALCRQDSDQPFASTRRVLDRLAEMDGPRLQGPDRVAELEREQADLLHVAAQ